MDYNSIRDLLKKHGQNHVLQFYNELNDTQKEKLLKQLASLDFDLLKKFNEMINENSHSDMGFHLEPEKVMTLSEREQHDNEMNQKGESLLRNGKVAAFLVAGGQGSRLGFEGPKGMYPITPVKKKSLFQLHAEKIIALQNKYNHIVPWYIMTSSANHDDTVKFFEDSDFFGLNPADVMFFSQEMLPAIDPDGRLILSEKEKIFMSPNGHGGSLKALWDSGAYADMTRRGIEYLFYFQVDNVLIKICDPVFLGYHSNYQSEMSSKVLRKAFPEEKVGVICRKNGKTSVVEYSDLNEKDTYATDEKGNLKYWAGSIAIHIINTSFIKKINEAGFQLPYHIANKTIPFINETGKHVKPEKPNGYKFETFVFDALELTEKTFTLEVNREEEFSALKNKSGVDSEETAIHDLNKLYYKWLQKAGADLNQVSDMSNIEISPLFADSADELALKINEIPKITNNTYLE